MDLIPTTSSNMWYMIRGRAGGHKGKVGTQFIVVERKKERGTPEKRRWVSRNVRHKGITFPCFPLLVRNPETINCIN